eukprot:TRINITY_DN117112_c0_g1_i1.p1 TRINITY_DN117112_c0_g1~~TRINITY_DN117112_c0_g1_i1.p1  ORF type:complete len:243 (+),score=98.26 TRINITY_DN117112_c0_g1_i1:34-729(+)
MMMMTKKLFAVALLLVAMTAAAAGEEACVGGQVLRRCSPGCPTTCDDLNPRQRPECDVLKCGDEERCVCPEERPIWDEEKQVCIRPSQCSNPHPRDIRVYEKTDECAEVRCHSADVPWKCPKGSRLAQAPHPKGCPSCLTCVSHADDKPVEVPECWRTQSACPPTNCENGYVPKMVQRAGQNGALPCCHVFHCVKPKNHIDPSLRRPVKGSRRRRRNRKKRQQPPQNKDEL